VNIAKAHAKARQAMKRREEHIEQEELEGGEINLIPYLDIVTNLMLFILASISSGLILGQLNTTIPDQGPPPSNMAGKPDTPPEERSLGLVIQVASDTIRVYSAVAEFQKLIAPPQSPIKFKRLPSVKGKDGQLDPVWVYDWRGVNDYLYKLASAWKGKQRAYPTYRVILQVDKDAPYGTVISAMDTLRCKLPPPGKEPESVCILPREGQGADGKPEIDPQTKKPVLIGPDGKKLTTPYDPDTMALFHDIIFSPGYQSQ